MPENGTIGLSEWLEVLDKEYLREFVSQGGAAVKFAVVPEPAGVESLRRSLSDTSTGLGFHFAFVDSVTTKVHLIEQVFFAIARQTDWDGLVLRFARKLFDQHYRLPPEGKPLTINELAGANGTEPKELRPEFKTLLKKGLLQDYRMALEFRSAMAALIKHQVDPEVSGTGVDEQVKAWLTGSLTKIKPLKEIGISQKVSRTNARYLLYSLSHWLTLCGHQGLVVMIDISRYLEEGQPVDGALKFGKTAVLDCYETLRQFIDNTDESRNTLLVVAAPLAFATEGEKRSVDTYTALKTRIWDDVRDRWHVNPLAPMVRLSSSPAGTA